MTTPTTPLCRLAALAALLALPTLTAAAVQPAAPPPRPPDELRVQLAGVAKALQLVLDGQGASTVAVGSFAGPPNLPTGAGPGIRLVLVEELKKLGVAVKDRDRLGVKGEYLLTDSPADGPRGGRLALELKGAMVDNLGKEVKGSAFDRFVFDERNIVEAIGFTGELPPGAPPAQRASLIRGFQGAKFAPVRGNQLRSSRDGPYGIELLVDDRPIPVQDREGLAYAPIERGQTYAVRLTNDSDDLMAVRLMIDGISLFTFSEERVEDGPGRGDPRYTVVYVSPHDQLVVPGWYKTGAESMAFKVTPYAQSGVARAGPPDPNAVGTVTATFAAAWTTTPPRDEPVARAGPGARVPGSPEVSLPDAGGSGAVAPRAVQVVPGAGPGSLPASATGFGQSVAAQYNAVRREIGVVRASVTVRYTK